MVKKKKITQQWCKPFSPEWYLKGILELQQNSSCETSISQMQSHLSICLYQISKQSVKTCTLKTHVLCGKKHIVHLVQDNSCTLFVSRKSAKGVNTHDRQ